MCIIIKNEAYQTFECFWNVLEHYPPIDGRFIVITFQIIEILKAHWMKSKMNINWIYLCLVSKYLCWDSHNEMNALRCFEESFSVDNNNNTGCCQMWSNSLKKLLIDVVLPQCWYYQPRNMYSFCFENMICYLGCIFVISYGILFFVSIVTYLFLLAVWHKRIKKYYYLKCIFCLEQIGFAASFRKSTTYE